MFRRFGFLVLSVFTFASALSYAQETVVIEKQPAVVVERPVIVTTVPAPRETIVLPMGYANCTTVRAGWYQDVWAAEHRVCHSSTSPGVVWVEGYWRCTRYNATDGQCTNWDWKTAHWERTFVVY